MIKRMNPAIFRICVFLMLFIVPLFKGCANGGTEIGNPSFPDPGLGTFSSDEALRSYILDQYSKNVLPDYSYGRGIVMEDDMDNGSADEGDASNEAPPPAAQDLDDHSETNVQEEGVDEADIVKNNGRYIYIARGDRVTIVDTEKPSSMTEAGAIAVVDGVVDSLYLYGKYLVILFIKDNGSRNYWNYPGPEAAMDIGYCYWLPVNSKIGVRIVDVSDPAAPATINETLIDGNIISSRRIGEKLYLIQQFLPDLPPFDYTYDHNTKNMDDVVSSNQKKLESVPLDDLVPGYFKVDKNGNESEEIQLVNYDHFYKPSETSGGSVVTITTFDLDDPTKPIESTGIIADAHTIYASTSALYIASTRWDDTKYQEKDYSGVYYTFLFKFSFTENGVVAAGTGSVSGKILNQFSLGEYEEVLRIATTNSPGDGWFDQTVTNSVYCLKAEEGKLNVIGKIEGIAKGETIYAARFMGKRGYLVTFVQVDPLFTLDLSDPYHPEIAGELKVPGYSNYIHPLSEDYLLTIGQDVETYEGSVLNKGIQLCIFDIRDFSNPTLLHQEIIGGRGTSSEAQYNHKAFTYWASKNLLAIPVNLYEETEGGPLYEYGNYKYSGLSVYRVSTETGFSPLGTLKTNSDTEWYYSSWTRGLFIDDHVFAVDEDAVHSAEYEAIDTTTTTLTLTDYKELTRYGSGVPIIKSERGLLSLSQ